MVRGIRFKKVLNPEPIRKYMEKNDLLTVSDFCKKCEISRQYFYPRLYGTLSISQNVISKIAKVIGCKEEELYCLKSFHTEKKGK